MKKLITICSLALAIGFFGVGTANAAEGTTTIDITLEPVVILHYFSDIDLTITSEAISQVISGAAGGAVDEGTFTVAAGGYPLSYNAAISPDTSGDANSATLTIENAWAVRSLSSNNVTVAIAIGTATLNGGSSGSITMSNPVVDDGTSSGTSIQFASPGLVVPRDGDVQLDLSFASVTGGGAFTGGQFTITATST